MNYQHTQATEIEFLEMSRADRQHLLHKLLAVLQQELHDVQLLVLETVRQELCEEGGVGAPRKEQEKRL